MDHKENMDDQNLANIETAYLDTTSTLSNQLRTGELLCVTEDSQELDDSFNELLDDINVSYLRTSVLHYDDEDRELMEAVHLMVEDVRSKLRSGGDLIHIGSCQDGTKIKRLDELDLLYVLPKSAKYQVIRTDIPHKFDVRDGLGNPVCPRKDRKVFADEVEDIFEQISLPQGLEHCGCVSPLAFSGVRYNGPAVTTLFTWQRTRAISIDMTQVLQLTTEDRAALQVKIKGRCKRVFDENPQRLFHIKGTYLYPNIVTNCWELSTAYCEADMLSNLASDSPFKTTIQVAKLICHRLAEHNVQTFSRFKITPSAETNRVQHFLLGLKTSETTTDLGTLRYGHAFLLPEHGSKFNELTKKLISINTAAVKHIALWTASKIPESFAPAPSTNILRYLLSEIFIYLASDEHNVQHFLVDSFIGLFAVAPWAVTGLNPVELIRVLKWQCRRIAWTVYPERFGLVDLAVRDHDLQQYILPTGGLCAEDTCEIAVDFTGKRCNIIFLLLVRLINALANFYGGLILLNGPNCSEGTMQIWKKAFIQHMTLFLSETSTEELVSVVVGSESRPSYIYVQRSREMWILNPNISTFKRGISQMIREPEALAQILYHKVMDSTDCVPIVTEDTYMLGEEVDLPSHVPLCCSEFKLTAPQLSTHYLASRLIELPLLSMQNSTTGGVLMLGTNEVQGKLLVTGVKLEQEKQAFFESTLSSIFEHCPVTKRRRICGENHLDALSQHDKCWITKFHPITGAADRVMISIHIRSHPMGFFYALPEVYTLSIEGAIEEMPYTSLKCSIQTRRTTNSLTQQRSPSSQAEDELPATDINTRNSSLEKSIHEVSETSNATRKDIKQKVEPYLQRTTELSWSENIDDWRQNLTIITKDLKDNAGKLVGGDLFQFHKPIKFIPPASVMCDACPLLTPELLEIITNNHSRSGFGIGAGTLSSLCSGGPTRPDSQGLDLLLLNDTSDIHIWVVSGAQGRDQIMQYRKYVTSLGIILKRQILKEIDRNTTNGHKPHNISIHCHILSEKGHEIDLPIQSIVLHHSKNAEVPPSDICWALARVFLSKETMLKNRIGHDFAIHLTAQQFEQEIQSMFRKFNVVEGPPGSGKTILAIRMYRSFPEGKAIFIASNPAMQAFIEYQGITSNALIDTTQDVDTLLHSDILIGRECIILDDVQHIVFAAKTWKKLFNFMSGVNAKLYAFMDNSCQSFNITKKSDSFLYHLEQYCEKRNIMLNVRRLDEVHRNSKKVVSYIKECHSQMCNIPCSSLEDGDDITIIKMANTKELRAKNPLVDYIKFLIESPLEWSPLRSYLVTDIAVLVDGPTSKADADIYRTVLQNGGFTVQTADKFPVEGIIVDSLDKFVGLDADVIIFMTLDIHAKHPHRSWRKSSKKGRLTNEKYKAFISSRAVSKLVFVIESDINFEITENLHLSSERIAKTMAKSMAEDQSDGVIELWHIGKTVAFTNACFLRMSSGLALICVTYRPDMYLISADTGENLPLGDAGFDVRTARKAEVSISHKYLAVLWNEVEHDKVRWRWSICSVEPSGFQHMYTHTLDRMPTSVCWTPEEEILFIVYEKKYKEPRLQKYNMDGQLLWDFHDDITKFDVPEDLALSTSGKMYVPEYYNHNIRVLSRKGHFRRNIPATGDDCRLRAPKAICVDSTGRWLWVGHRPTNRQQVSLVSMDGKNIIPVIETKTAVFYLDIYDANLLAVGTRNGLLLYDVSSVYTNLKL